jgi:hypothetical protein
MVRAFPQQFTTAFFKMPEKLFPLHLYRKFKLFPDDLLPGKLLLRELLIGFHDKANSFSQILSRFPQSGTLGIGAGKLLDDPDIALFYFLKDGGK